MEKRLTSLAHGGGCGCKLAPGILGELLAGLTPTRTFDRLLVGNETNDDAAVWALSDELNLVSTIDFFTPIVDDPYDFGRIAATNAISDVYAMGATPIMALAVTGMPLEEVSKETIIRIMEGGSAACGAANIPIAGGHSISSPEPIYGLAVIGTGRPEQLRQNSTAREGDLLILTKPLGVGVYSAALKKGQLPHPLYQELIEQTTRLNRAGTALGSCSAVHAMTDVTGFGLLGHAAEMGRSANLSVALCVDTVPLLSSARQLAELGFFTGASKRNWDSLRSCVSSATGISDIDTKLLSDPQTSGGLLVACDSELAPDVLQLMIEHEVPAPAIVGKMKPGPFRIELD
jgi:selenide, water dikinase